MAAAAAGPVKPLLSTLQGKALAGALAGAKGDGSADAKLVARLQVERAPLDAKLALFRDRLAKSEETARETMGRLERANEALDKADPLPALRPAKEAQPSRLSPPTRRLMASRVISRVVPTVAASERTVV